MHRPVSAPRTREAATLRQITGEKPKGLLFRTQDSPEVTLVEREHILTVITMREHDDGGIGESKSEISVPLDELAGGSHLVGSERLKLVDTAGHIVQHDDLGTLPTDASDQVVQLGEDERGEDEPFRTGKD